MARLQSRSSGRRGIRWVMFVTLVGLWAVAGFPRSELRTHLIGLGGDPLQTFWRFQASSTAALQGSLTVAGDPIRNLSAVPWLPLHWVFGEPLTQNLVWLLQGPLTILAMSALARRLGIPRGPAFLAGILVVFAPYRLSQSLGHFGAFQLWWIPSVLAAVLWWKERPVFPRLATVVFFLTGVAWTEHTLFLTTLVGVCALLLVYAREFLVLVRTHPVQVLCTVGLFLLGAVFPFREELRSAVLTSSTLRTDATQRLRFAPTLRSFVFPSPTHLFRRADAPYGSPRSSVADHVHTLNPGALLLAIAACAMCLRSPRRKTVLLLGMLTAGGVLLALLPRIPGGVAFSEQLPVLSAVRTVDRFLALSVIAVPLLAALALMQRARAIAAGFSLLLLVEILPAQIPRIDLQPLRATALLLQGAAGSKTLEVGAASDYLIASEALAASALHGKEVIGHAAFQRVDQPVSDRKTLLRFPGIRDLLLLRITDLIRPTVFGQTPSAALRAGLWSTDVGSVILRTAVQGELPVRATKEGPAVVTPEELTMVRSVLLAAGFAEQCTEPHLCAYRTPPENGPWYAIGLGVGWDLPLRTEQGTVRLAMHDGAELVLRVSGNTPPLTLSLLPAGDQPQLLRLTREGQEQKISLVPQQRTKVPLGAFSEGEHSVTFHIDANTLLIENPSILSE